METITLVDLSPQLVAGIRKKGPYRLIAQLLPKLYTYAASAGAEFTGFPVFLCHESAEEAAEADREEKADVEVAAPIKEKIPETEEIGCYTLPGGKFAKTVHKGPYEECGPTYDALFKWIEEKGLKITGPIREYYLNDPNEIKSDEILTEIYAPVD